MYSVVSALAAKNNEEAGRIFDWLTSSVMNSYPEYPEYVAQTIVREAIVKAASTLKNKDVIKFYNEGRITRPNFPTTAEEIASAVDNFLFSEKNDQITITSTPSDKVIWVKCIPYDAPMRINEDIAPPLPRDTFLMCSVRNRHARLFRNAASFRWDGSEPGTEEHDYDITVYAVLDKYKLSYNFETVIDNSFNTVHNRDIGVLKDFSSTPAVGILLDVCFSWKGAPGCDYFATFQLTDVLDIYSGQKPEWMSELNIKYWRFHKKDFLTFPFYFEAGLVDMDSDGYYLRPDEVIPKGTAFHKWYPPGVTAQTHVKIKTPRFNSETEYSTPILASSLFWEQRKEDPIMAWKPHV